MQAQAPRVTDQAESCLVSQAERSRNQTSSWSNDGLEAGIVDLYARRQSAVRAHSAVEQKEAIERIVVTQPFGRAFTAQPSYPPDPVNADEVPVGGIAGIRRKLAGVTIPARKLATS